MKTEPYEKFADRHNRIWSEAAKVLGVHPVVLREIYIQKWFVGMQSSDFLYLIHNGEQQSNRKQDWRKKVKEECEALGWTPEQIAAKQAKSAEFEDDNEFTNILQYRLKQLIEVGDELLSDETKTYCFSEKQYITKGKRYKIVALKDEDGTKFGYQTETDLPVEVDYGSNYGVKSLWRDGKEIWNWWQAYHDLWVEQNPDHPKTQEMIDYTKNEIKKFHEENHA